MSVAISFCIILFFLVLGEVASYLISNFIPGSVIGMLLLFVALLLKWVKPENVRPAATFLIKNMPIFFIPAFILEQWDIIRLNLVEWILVVLLSTIAVFLTSGFTAKIVMKAKQRKEEKC